MCSTLTPVSVPCNILLQVYSACQGLHHPETSSCLAQLVALLRSSAKSSTALPLARRVLEIKTNSLGEGHLEVAVATTSVAELMSDMGRYEEVVKLCGRVLEIYRQQGNSKMFTRPIITVQVGFPFAALSLVVRSL